MSRSSRHSETSAGPSSQGPRVLLLLCVLALVFFPLPDAAQAAKILQTRIDSQADGDAFYPETIDQWKAAKVLQNGAYVAMIASGEHQTEIEDAWNAQFGA